MREQIYRNRERANTVWQELSSTKPSVLILACWFANNDSASELIGKLEKPARHFLLNPTAFIDVRNYFVCSTQTPPCIRPTGPLYIIKHKVKI